MEYCRPKGQEGDVSWESFLATHHIIALQETWEANETYHLDGFTSFFKRAIPSSMGRARGGLLLLINLKLLYKVVLIESCSPNILAVELTGKNLPTLLVVDLYNSFTRNDELEHLNALAPFLVNYAGSSETHHNIGSGRF